MSGGFDPDADAVPAFDGVDWGEVRRAASALRSGLVIGIPTDTVYGLAAAIDQHRAIERLYTTKGRPRDKPIPVLLSDMANLGKVAAGLNAPAEWLARRFWPGALTLIVAALPGLHPDLTGTDAIGAPTVAIRVPDHGLARVIIAAAGGALAVTSANRSGQPPALSAEAVRELGRAVPDVIVDGGEARHAAPSTIVLATEAQPVVVREGAIPARLISLVLEENGWPMMLAAGAADREV